MENIEEKIAELRKLADRLKEENRKKKCTCPCPVHTKANRNWIPVPYPVVTCGSPAGMAGVTNGL